MKEVDDLKKQIDNIQTSALQLDKIVKEKQQEIERLNNSIDKAIKKLNKYRNRKDTWGLWCMEYGDNAEIIKILGGEVKNE